MSSPWPAGLPRPKIRRAIAGVTVTFDASKGRSLNDLDDDRLPTEALVAMARDRLVHLAVAADRERVRDLVDQLDTDTLGELHADVLFAVVDELDRAADVIARVCDIGASGPT